MKLTTEITIEVPKDVRDRWLELHNLPYSPESIKQMLHMFCEAIKDGHISLTDEIFFRSKRLE